MLAQDIQATFLKIKERIVARPRFSSNYSQAPDQNSCSSAPTEGLPLHYLQPLHLYTYIKLTPPTSTFMPRKLLDNEGWCDRLIAPAGFRSPCDREPRRRQPKSAPAEAHCQVDRGINVPTIMTSFYPPTIIPSPVHPYIFPTVRLRLVADVMVLTSDCAFACLH